MSEMSAATKNYSVSGPAVDLVVPADCAGLRLDQVLARLLPEHSINRVARWIREARVSDAMARGTREARVSVDCGTSSPRSKMWGGERVRVMPGADPEALAYRPQE